MYKIGEAAKLMRLSTEALRFYERLGIIKPHKSVDSKYRYFDARQINHMLNMQKYQKFGFSLYEVWEMFQNSDDDQFQDYMRIKQNELIEKSVFMRLRVFHIHVSLEHMRLARQAEKKLIIGVRPAMYRMSYMCNEKLIVNDQLDKELQKWAMWNDLQFLSEFMSIENYKKQNSHSEYGFAMFKDTAECMQIESNEVVSFHEECSALIYCFESTGEGGLYECLPMVDAYMKEHQYHLVGEIITQILYSKYENGVCKMRNLVWFPYEKNK